MKKKIYIIAICTVITFLFFGTSTKAEVYRPVYDSTCCAPDSLRLVSVDDSSFCVIWRVPSDSACLLPQGFEIEWKLLTDLTWHNEYVPYISGNVINFCDSVDTCGVYRWRVRTKCNDSTYSNWVNAAKMTIPCPGRPYTQKLSISPNPASGMITINMNSIKQKQYKLSVVSMAGKTMIEKTVYIKDDERLREELSTNGWQKGIYFVTILSNNAVISRGSFVKE